MAEKATTAARRLSFIEDLSASEDKKRFSQSMERRQSIWNNPRKSIYVNTRRLSYSMSHSSRKSSQDLPYPRIRLQNTYRTEPLENERFQPYRVEPKLYALLEDALKDVTYDAFKSNTLSKELSQDILRETRLLMNGSSQRYKLICYVVIGEMQGQDIRFGSRCLWDTRFDNMASVIYKNSSLYAVATIFAIYFE